MRPVSANCIVREMTSVLEIVDSVLFSIDNDGIRLAQSLWDAHCAEITVAVEAVEAAMSRCLGDPMLAPFVNEQGVRQMLDETAATLTTNSIQSTDGTNSHSNWVSALQARREVCVKGALEALRQLPEPFDDFRRCVEETLLGSAFPVNSWRTFEWPPQLDRTACRALTTFLSALRDTTLPELRHIVCEISQELDTENTHSTLSEGQQKIKELLEMAAWYKSTSVASMEWSRELRRREQWQSAVELRMAAMRKELTRMCDAETLERTEFARHWQLFLPKGGGFALAHEEKKSFVPQVQLV